MWRIMSEKGMIRMKRIITLSLVLVFALCSTVFAAGVNGTFDGYNIVRVKYEGKELPPDTVPGILYKGSTLVPLGLLRKAGFNVEWDKVNLTANITPTKPDKPLQTVKTLEEIKALQNRIALIYALDDSGNRIRQGSGFILNSRGLLVTAWHVADENGFRKLEVIVNGKTYFVPRGVYVFQDKDKDIFGVYLQDEKPFPYLKVGGLPEEKDKVYALGYRQEQYVTIEGTVSFLANQKIYDDTLGKPGASGGATINQFGEVVGVIIQGDDNVGISVNIDEVLLLNQKSFNQ